MNIDQKAFSDPRVVLLAKRLGCAAPVDAIGRLALLWMTCTENGSDRLDHDVVSALLQVDHEVIDGAAIMVQCGLAERAGETQVRIRGCKGRIEWLSKKRKASRKGGAKTKAKWQEKGKAKTGPHGLDVALPREGPPAPAPAPAPAQKQRQESLFRGEALRLWQLQERLRAEAIPRVRQLKPTGERLERIIALLEAARTPEECEHVLCVFAGSAKTQPESAKWFNGDTNWRPENFERALGQPIPGQRPNGGAIPNGAPGFRRELPPI